MMRRASFTALALALAIAPSAAFAQRADDNATTSAEDAFGTSIGGEQIGIYNPNYVRGSRPSRRAISASTVSISTSRAVSPTD